MPQSVHAVLARSLVPLAGLRLGDDTGPDESGLPHPRIEVGTANCAYAVGPGEQQPLCHERTVRPKPGECDLRRWKHLAMPLENVRDVIRQRHIAHLVALGGTEDEVTAHDLDLARAAIRCRT